MRVARAAIAVAAMVFGVVGQAHGQNLLTNGGFETPAQGPNDYATFNIPAGSTYITGWTVTQGNVDLTTAVDYGPGANTLDTTSVLDVDLIGDVNGSNGVQGGLSQTFATTAGQLYSLTFDYSHNNGSYSPIYSALVSVNDGSAAGSLLYSTTVSQPNGASPWQAFTDTFTATSGTTTLSFTNTAGGTQGGIYLDDVSVAPLAGGVPELATWAMTILGFGAAGLSLRRRRHDITRQAFAG